MQGLTVQKSPRLLAAENPRPISEPARGRPRLEAVRTLAWNTFLEAVRDRVLYLLLFFGLFVFGASRLLSPLALGEGRRITIDLGFAAISGFGCLTTIFVGHQLIFREIERKTLYFLLSRPLSRGRFIAGKYLGLWLTLVAALGLMSLLLAGVLLVSGYPFGWSYLQACVLALCEISILSAVAVLFASAASPMLAGLLTLAAWVIGHGSGDLWTLLRSSGSAPVHALIRVVSWLVPRLDLYADNIPVLRGVPYPAGQMLYGVLYAMAYCGACLLLATLAFSRREPAL